MLAEKSSELSDFSYLIVRAINGKLFKIDSHETSIGKTFDNTSLSYSILDSFPLSGEVLVSLVFLSFL